MSDLAPDAEPVAEPPKRPVTFRRVVRTYGLMLVSIFYLVALVGAVVLVVALLFGAFCLTVAAIAYVQVALERAPRDWFMAGLNTGFALLLTAGWFTFFFYHRDLLRYAEKCFDKLPVPPFDE